MSAEENLSKLNINLPKAPDPVGSYVASKIVGNLIYISGQVSFNLKAVSYTHLTLPTNREV